MDHKNECYSTQFIDGNGAFSADKLDNFIKEVELEECGSSYAVVAIMGPQSSGKSTLLNHLFHTNFREMDAKDGRHQTTRGTWIAKCPGIEPSTIVLDLEGTDGSERGEDDIAFENQSALFLLAICDIVLINMWCHDIGRERASSKPLLRTVFMVMLRLFGPRKTITLMFILRDKSKTPSEKFESDLKEDIQRLWDGIPKPEAYKHTQLSDVFNIQVVVLDSYEREEEQFRLQVASLRQKFIQSIAPGGLAGDRQGVVPASGFSFSAQRIWKVIKENKDLDLPAHKIMVATIRCEQIANETYSSFVANKDWLEIEDAIQANEELEAVQSLLSKWHNKCLSSYDDATSHYETSVRLAKRKQLEEKLVQVMFRVTQEAKTKAKKEAKKGIEKNWINVAANSVIVAASSVIVAAAAVGVVSLGPAAPVVAITAPVVAITAKVALIVTITLCSFWKKNGGKEVKVTGKVASA